MVSISASGIGCAGRTRDWAASIARIVGLAAAAAATLGAASPTAQLDLTVEGLRSARGLLQVCLTTNPRRFPDCADDPLARRLTVPAAQPRVSFAGLPSGEYAVALIHDENGNARLDTRLGIPVEGVGFSRNPRLMFGAPKFAAARFAVTNREIAETVRMKYFL